ncbi:GTP-binding protein [Micromonospora sp. WMMA1996]|uniref:GTP-binding protein n=1 Tax=Micromonospora sp. WMMA1996 TaxID=2039878 RepID=UPI00350E41D7
MQTVNLGIVAHVDAGKTSLTERLLHATGAVDRLGSVDAGTTRTDTGEIERRRGITIRSAVPPSGYATARSTCSTPGTATSLPRSNARSGCCSRPSSRCSPPSSSSPRPAATPAWRCWRRRTRTSA